MQVTSSSTHENGQNIIDGDYSYKNAGVYEYTVEKKWNNM